MKPPSNKRCQVGCVWDGHFDASNVRVDRSARSSFDMNLEFHTRARSRERYALRA
jgi:hypothetical protein